MSHRLAQIQSVIQQTLAYEINRFLTGDEGLVTVSYVEVQPDLKAANIWIAFEKPLSSNAVIQALNDHRQIFQKQLARKYNFKHTPIVTFKVDEGQNKQESVEQLIDQL